MNKMRRTIGQILLAIGVTLAIGGMASFVVENVELRFVGNIIADDTGRVVWIIVNVVIASMGFFLWRLSQTKDNAT